MSYFCAPCIEVPLHGVFPNLKLGCNAAYGPPFLVKANDLFLNKGLSATLLIVLAEGPVAIDATVILAAISTVTVAPRVMGKANRANRHLGTPFRELITTHPATDWKTGALTFYGGF